MSILGDGFDTFVSSLGGIVDFIVNLILGVAGIILSLFSNMGILLTILNYIFSLLDLFVSIILNPYLLCLFILGTGFYYASFTAETKKDLLKKTGVYYKYVFETTAKVANGIYTIVHKIIMAIVDTV
jgi:hypothetical protein